MNELFEKILEKFNPENVSSEKFGLLLFILGLYVTTILFGLIEEKYPKRFNEEWKFYIPFIGIGLMLIPTEYFLEIPFFLGMFILLYSIIELYKHFRG